MLIAGRLKSLIIAEQKLLFLDKFKFKDENSFQDVLIIVSRVYIKERDPSCILL